MYYIIQENLFREEGFTKLINFMERFHMDYELVTVKSGTDEVEYKTDRKDVFCFGALKLARVTKNTGWYPGCLITENHDYEVYSKHYKENLLNYDSKIIKISEQIDFTQDLFIRPTMDSKIFTGKVFKKYDWEETQYYLLNDKTYQKTVTPETLIQVAKPKFITQEIRFWIVDGKIVTQSTYRRGTFLVYDNIVDADAIEFVQKMIDIYCVEKCFTMDVCLSNEGWKIVECGSISCAGFYDSDIQKLIMALEDVKW